MKKVALPKRSSASKTKGRKMAKKKATRKRKPATTRAKRRAVKSKAKKSRVTLYKRGNKYYAPRKSGRYSPTLRKGMKINPSRKRRRIKRNPKFSLKKVLNTKLVINGALIAGGFIAGAYVAQKVREMVPQLAGLGKFSGVLNIGLGLVGASFMKGEKAKMVSLGMVASGAYDLIQTNVMPMIAPSAPAVSGVGFTSKMQHYSNLGADTSLLGADTSLLGSDAVLLGDEYEHEMMDIEEAF